MEVGEVGLDIGVGLCLDSTTRLRKIHQKKEERETSYTHTLIHSFVNPRRTASNLHGLALLSGALLLRPPHLVRHLPHFLL